MKKYIIGAVLLSVGFSFASAQTSDVDTSNDNSCAIITSNLRYLSRDANGSTDVSILQDFLNTRGYLKSQPTGFFGSATRRAVIAFQNDNGLRATPPGYVGAGTRAKIKDIDCNFKEVSPNSDSSAGSADSNIISVPFNNTSTYTAPVPQFTNNSYTYTTPITQDNSFSLLAPTDIERGNVVTRVSSYAKVCWKSGKDNKDQTLDFVITAPDGKTTPSSLGSTNLSQGCFIFIIPAHLPSGGYVVTAKSKSSSLSATSPSFTLQGSVSTYTPPTITAFSNKDPNPTTGATTIIWNASKLANVALDMVCTPDINGINFTTSNGNTPTCAKGGVWTWQGLSNGSITIIPSGNFSPITLKFTLTVLDQNGTYTNEKQTIAITFPATVTATPKATIDQSSLTTSSNHPRITGTAHGVKNIGLSIGNNGGKFDGTGNFTTDQYGNWGVTLNNQTYTPGTYQIDVYSDTNVLLTSAKLNVTAAQ